MSTTGFDRNRIIELLTELGRRLSAKGVAGRLYIVGGAAMALEFDTRRTTRDIDAVLHPPTTVADEAASMATDLGLPPGWASRGRRCGVVASRSWPSWAPHRTADCPDRLEKMLMCARWQARSTGGLIFAPPSRSPAVRSFSVEVDDSSRSRSALGWRSPIAGSTW